jgi:hypothetical protein
LTIIDSKAGLVCQLFVVTTSFFLFKFVFLVSTAYFMDYVFW